MPVPEQDTVFRTLPTPALTPNKYSAEQLGPNCYNHYTIRSSVVTFEGILQLPIAALPGTLPAKIVRVHAPYTRKTVQWTVRRLGDKPTLPYPDTGDPNEQLAYKEIIPLSPVIQPGGDEYLHVVEGTYIFFRQMAPSNLDTQPPATPVTNDPPEVFTYLDFKFNRTLLRQAPSNGTIQIKQLV